MSAGPHSCHICGARLVTNDDCDLVVVEDGYGYECEPD